MSSGLHALLLQVGGHAPRELQRLLLDQRLGQRQLRRSRAGPSSPGPSAPPRPCASVRASGSPRLRARRSSTLAALDAECRGERAVERRHVGRASPASPSARTARSFRRLPCRDSRPETSARKSRVSPAAAPASAASNSGSMRPSPSVIAKSFAWPPGNSTPSIVPVKSTITRSPVCAPRATGSNTARCLRSTSSVRSMSASRHLDLRPLDRDGREVAQLDLGIDLEHRGELERLARRRPAPCRGSMRG